MRIYISGGITNVPDYWERFTRAEEKLTALGYEVINPARVNAELPPMEWEEYMSVSITLLSQADAIYLLRQWSKSLGSNREYGYALGAGLIVMEQQ